MYQFCVWFDVWTVWVTGESVVHMVQTGYSQQGSAEIEEAATYINGQVEEVN